MAWDWDLMDDPEVDYREFIAWWVPIEDDRYTRFTLEGTPRVDSLTHTEGEGDERERRDHPR